MYTLASCSTFGNKKVIKFLLKNDAYVEACDYEGKTPLMDLLESDRKVTKGLEYLLKFSDVNKLQDSFLYDIDDNESKFIFMSPCSRKSVILQHMAKLKAMDLTVRESILKAISNHPECQVF